MAFSVVLDPRAIGDIQQAIDYYDEQKAGLGTKFESALNKQILTLEKHPFFSIRYDQVRCLPLKKYPFMIHFTIDEEQALVIIHAVFHTSLDPENWKTR